MLVRVIEQFFFFCGKPPWRAVGYLDLRMLSLERSHFLPLISAMWASIGAVEKHFRAFAGPVPLSVEKGEASVAG